MKIFESEGNNFMCLWTNFSFVFKNFNLIVYTVYIIRALRYIKVSKFQNEDMKSSHFPEYEQKN